MLSAANVTIEFLLGLALALAMVKHFPGRGLIMSILIIPLFISPVIVGQAWALLLQRPFGPTNYLLGQLLRPEVTIGWLTESPWIYIALIIADVWQWTPFMFVILLAGLTSIPPNLYEAAELDGVGAWQAFRLITLPLLAPMILLAITFRLLDAIKLFDTIFIMTGGGPGTKTYTTSFYLYTVGFTQFHLSQATAGSWIFLILTAARGQLLVRRLLEGGDGLMRRRDRRPAEMPPKRRRRRRRRRSDASCSSALFLLFVLGAALLDVHHLDQAERRLSRRAAGLVPGHPDARPLHGGAVRLSRARRASSTASSSRSRRPCSRRLSAR